jgi:hypothetical protein
VIHILIRVVPTITPRLVALNKPDFEVFGKITGDARYAGVEDFIFATKQTSSSD